MTFKKFSEVCLHSEQIPCPIALYFTCPVSPFIYTPFQLLKNANINVL